MQHRDHSKLSQHSHIKHVQRTKMGQVIVGCSWDVKRQSQSRHKKERTWNWCEKKSLDQQHNKKKPITITSKNKTYIPGCIIQIKQLDLVTILLEISIHVGEGEGVDKQSTKGWKAEKEQSEREGEKSSFPKKEKVNKSTWNTTPGIRTVCHKLRPVHYNYYYYNYKYTNSSIQSNQTKLKRKTKWQHSRRTEMNSKVNPILVQKCIWLRFYTGCSDTNPSWSKGEPN